MWRSSKIAIAAGALALGAQAAFGEVIYDVPTDPTSNDLDNIKQQGGNAQAYYGDDVKLAGGPRLLQKITIHFGFYTYDADLTYTPSFEADVWNVDGNGIPLDSNSSDSLSYTPIAQAFRTDVTFTGSAYNNGGVARDTQQNVTFDFSAANLVLPDHFAFGYRDNKIEGNYFPGYGTSMFISDNGIAQGLPGSSSTDGYLSAYTNTVENTTFSFNANDYNLEAKIEAIQVPEPATAGILTIGALSSLRRRRK